MERKGIEKYIPGKSNPKTGGVAILLQEMERFMTKVLGRIGKITIIIIDPIH